MSEPITHTWIEWGDLDAECQLLRAQVAALTKLVREAEWDSQQLCPWCGAFRVEQGHASECPARPWLGAVK